MFKTTKHWRLCSVAVALALAGCVQDGATNQPVSVASRPAEAARTGAPGLVLKATNLMKADGALPISAGQAVDILSGESGFYRVMLRSNGQAIEGIVSQDVVLLQAPEAAAGGTAAVRKSANLRAKPGEKAAILGTLKDGAPLAVLSASPEGWYEVSAKLNNKDRIGWVRADRMSIAFTGAAGSAAAAADSPTAKAFFAALVAGAKEIIAPEETGGADATYANPCGDPGAAKKPGAKGKVLQAASKAAQAFGSAGGGQASDPEAGGGLAANIADLAQKAADRSKAKARADAAAQPCPAAYSPAADQPSSPVVPYAAPEAEVAPLPAASGPAPEANGEWAMPTFQK